MEESFSFRHFTPTLNLKNYADSILTKQMKRFRGGVFRLAVLSRVNDTYFCCLTFLRQGRLYLADSNSHNPQNALQRAEGILFYKLTTEELGYPEYLINDWTLDNQSTAGPN